VSEGWWTRPGSCRLGEPKAKPICLSTGWADQAERSEDWWTQTSLVGTKCELSCDESTSFAALSEASRRRYLEFRELVRLFQLGIPPGDRRLLAKAIKILFELRAAPVADDTIPELAARFL
jgi:hypothetical protein